MDVVDHSYSKDDIMLSVIKSNSSGSGVKKMEKRKKSAKARAKEEEEKPFGCSECHKRFTRKGDMYRHLRSHTGEKPFSCPQCGDDFTRKDDMVRHLRTHQGLKPFDCAHCDRKFSRRSDMYKHMVTHAGVKVEQESCPTCGCQNAKHVHKIDVPVARKRGRPKGSKGNVYHKCSVCSSAFSRKRDLTRHLRTHSIVDIINMATSNVNTVATNKENESQHENVHVELIEHDAEVNCETIVQEVVAPVVPQVMPEYKVVLITNSLANAIGSSPNIQIVTPDKSLENVLLSLRNDKPFVCPQCGDKFGRKSDMVRHLRIHSGLKPFNCNLCGRPFSRKEDMNRHVLTHSTLKPYTCSVCTKTFSRKRDFDMHSAVHATEGSNECKSTESNDLSDTSSAEK